MKSLISLKAFLILTLIPSNTFFGCGTCPQPNPFFEITSLNTTNLVYTNGQFNELSSQDVVSYEEYNLEISFQVNYITQSKGSNGMAFALSCFEDGYGGTKAGVQSFDITTIGDYDELHPNGSSIADLITISYNDSNYTVETFLQETSDKLELGNLIVILNSPPSGPDYSIEFEITLTLKDGSSFFNTTQTVNFAQ